MHNQFLVKGGGGGGGLKVKNFFPEVLYWYHVPVVQCTMTYPEVRILISRQIIMLVFKQHPPLVVIDIISSINFVTS